jgi:hypothetical protein
MDIEDAITLYGANSDPAMQTMDDGTGRSVTLLTSPQLDLLSSATEVDEVAKRLLGIVNGVLFILEPGRIPLAAAGVLEQRADGKWNHHVIAETFIDRSRLSAVGMTIAGGKPSPQHTRPPPALRWSAAAQSDQVVGDVLIFLSGDPDWFKFYKAFELMRDDINQRIGGQHRQEQMGWPAKKDLDHFTLSAQVYRHAPPWDGDYTPAKAMPLGEAAQYIQSLAGTWLAWRFP